MSPVKLDRLSTRPGVYHFRDAKGTILYVGKARSLRSRVRSYFRSDPARSARTHQLVQRIDSVETIVVGSEAEALILEANLIKEHRPRFNIQLRDDKSYPYIKVTVGEPFPRVYVTRQVRNDGSRYFGPYTSVSLMRQALEVVKRLYTVRSCRYDLPQDAPDRPCLDHHIGRCLAPCVGLQSHEDYRAMIDQILRVLGGGTEEVRRQVEDEMRAAADGLDFERASRLRDILKGLDNLARHQRVQRMGGGDHDVVGLARDGALAVAVVLKIRGGLLLGKDTQRFKGVDEEDEAALLASLASRYYLGRGERGIQELPREILFPGDFEDREVLAEILSEATGRKVRIHVPQRGEKRRLVELAAANARHTVEDRVTALHYAADRADEALYHLQDRLDLKVVPRLMAGRLGQRRLPLHGRGGRAVLPATPGRGRGSARSGDHRRREGPARGGRRGSHRAGPPGRGGRRPGEARRGGLPAGTLRTAATPTARPGPSPASANPGRGAPLRGLLQSKAPAQADHPQRAQ